MNPDTLTAALIGDLANVSIASTPVGIEQQEAAGQRTLADPLREAVRQLTSLPRKGTPVADLTEGEKLALCIAAGAPTETTIENGRLVMRTAVQCGVVDRGDGGYIVAVGAREPMVTYLVESDKTMKQEG